MAKKKERIYSPDWKDKLYSYLKELGEVVEVERPPFGLRRVIKIKGWEDFRVETEIREEYFTLLPGGKIRFYRLKEEDGTFLTCRIKPIVPPGYLDDALLRQLVAKIPDMGESHLLVLSSRNKIYPVEFSPGFRVDLDLIEKLREVKGGGKVWALLDTYTKPWKVVKVVIEEEEEEVKVEGKLDLSMF